MEQLCFNVSYCTITFFIVSTFFHDLEVPQQGIHQYLIFNKFGNLYNSLNTRSLLKFFAKFIKIQFPAILMGILHEILLLIYLFQQEKEACYLTLPKRSHILKQTYSLKLQVCLSICDLLVDTKSPSFGQSSTQYENLFERPIVFHIFFQHFHLILLHTDMMKVWRAGLNDCC